MGNGYDHHSIHQHFSHQKTIFLPLLCRLSIKDIKLNHRHNDPSVSDEPSSPKVSCMGQVKRSNRVIGFPAPAPVTNHRHKYSKLKKLFSSRALLSPITSSTGATTSACVAVSAAARGGRSGSKSCRGSTDMCANNLRRLKVMKDSCNRCEQDYVKVVDIGALDPPLPVVKRMALPGVGRDGVNIWKRRFNGEALKSLQIEKIHLPINSNSQRPTV